MLPDRMCLAARIGALSVALLIPSSAFAQEVITIPSEPSCSRCTIDLDYFTTIGLGESRDYIGLTAAVARTKAGFAFVAPAQGSELVEVDLDGNVRVLGTRGEGPGEYRLIAALLSTPGDSLYVFDRRNLRLTVLSPSRELVRTVRFPRSTLEMPVVLLGSGDMVVNAVIPSRELIGYPLHRIDADGRIIRSFGARSRETRQDQLLGPGSIRVLFGGGGDSVWAANPFRYRIDRFDELGRLVATLVGTAPWGARPSNSELRAGRPDGALIGISRLPSSRRHILVLFRIGDPDWAEQVRPDGHGGYTVVDHGQYYDSVLDVIDTTTGDLVARQIFDPFLVSFPEPGTVTALRVTELGEELLEVYRVSLSDPQVQGSRAN